MLVLLTPLITTPYLSRVLGAEGIGTVSFVESIVYYFVLFATLGITTYGQREISYVRDDYKLRTKVFWETKILEIIISIFVLGLYIIFSSVQQNKFMYYIFSFYILAVTVDVVWLFQGLEEFGKIVIRNLFFKLVSIIYIFTTVHNEKDILKYVFGLAFFLFLSNLSLCGYLKGYIGIPKWKYIRPFRNIKIVISMFVPTIAISIYTVLDKTMIGLITKDAIQNGYYEQAIKISRMVLTIVTSLGTVMIPRIGYYFGKGDIEQINTFMYRAYRFVWFIGVPLCFGIVATASNFVPWFYGNSYSEVILLLKVLSFLILAIGINNVTGMQYLIPTKRQNTFTVTVLVGAVTNLVLNIILIGRLQALGAAIASVAAETTIALVQLFIIRKELSILKIFKCSLNYLLAGIFMLLVLIFLGEYLEPNIFNSFIMILIGAFIYFGVLLLIRDSFFMENTKSIMRKVINH